MGRELCRAVALRYRVERSPNSVPPAPEPVAALRRSVNLVAAEVGELAVACPWYVRVNRPGLVVGTIVTLLSLGSAGNSPATRRAGGPGGRRRMPPW